MGFTVVGCVLLFPCYVMDALIAPLEKMREHNYVEVQQLNYYVNF